VEETLWFIVGVAVLVAGLAVSIALHEWGHFYPAKKFGVYVQKFMVGFGPTLWSMRRGETEYGLKAIPLGGYVSMQGMFAPTDSPATATKAPQGTDFAGPVEDVDLEDVDPERSFYRLSVPKRIVVMLGGPSMNLVIATVLYAVLLMGFGLVQPGLTVGSVSECVVPASQQRTTCTADDPIAPGAAAGVLPGDEIVSIGNQAVDSWSDVTEVVRASAGRPLALVVNRDGQPTTLSVTPLLTERFSVDDRGNVETDDDGNPVLVEVGFVGIGATLETVRQPITAVLPAVWDNTVGVATILATLPDRMVQVAQAAFGTEERDPNGPVSVVGVGRIAGEIASIDSIDPADRVAGFIALLASLNVALFVFNLVPLLPLDGGHVAVALFDGARKRLATLRGRPEPGPINPGRLVPITLVVVVLLVGMSVLLMYADIVNPISLVQ
jgi:membrane-associated protease RseP (regulator of RpoE activity)